MVCYWALWNLFNISMNKCIVTFLYLTWIAERLFFVKMVLKWKNNILLFPTLDNFMGSYGPIQRGAYIGGLPPQGLGQPSTLFKYATWVCFSWSLIIVLVLHAVLNISTRLHFLNWAVHLQFSFALMPFVACFVVVLLGVHSDSSCCYSNSPAPYERLQKKLLLMFSCCSWLVGSSKKHLCIIISCEDFGIAWILHLSCNSSFFM